MADYAVVKNNKVINVIEWDGIKPYDPGDGCVLIPAAEAAKSATVDSDKFFPPATESGGEQDNNGIETMKQQIKAEILAELGQ